MYWSELDWSQTPPEKRGSVFLDLITDEIKKNFSGEKIKASPEEVWLRARFGALGEISLDISDKDARQLFRFSSWLPVAWDVAEEICLKYLLATQTGSEKSLPFHLRAFVALRMKGDAPRPTPSKGKGNKRDLNLLRNYYISDTLEKLISVGLNKDPAVQLIAAAFNNAGDHMITVDTVRHVKRQHKKYLRETDLIQEAEAAFKESVRSDKSGLLDLLCKNWKQ